jgi:O-antigen ligase
MPPALAAALTILAIALLLHFDAKFSEKHSRALWLPVLWLGITGSRFVSQWMNLSDIGASASYDEGSPIDALYFMGLIALAARVLMQRGIDFGRLLVENKWLFALLLFSLVSIAWSDFPFIAFKRWIKTLGHPLMALIIITEAEPMAALRWVLKRCAFFLLSVSVLFIKYYPEYGRGFDNWTGTAFNNGIGLSKNDLGYVCMAMGIFFVWNLLTAARGADGKWRPWEIGLSIGFIWMDLWLLTMSDSATSLMTMGLGVLVMLLLGLRIVSKRYIGTLVVTVALLAWWLESTFDVYAQVVEMLGRDPSLTDRTEVWADVLAMQDKPLLGFGFETFWLGPRLDILWEKWWWKPNQAHNGYIEMYLNLGAVGLGLFAVLLISTFRKIGRQLLTDFAFARLRLAFLFAILAFSYTEAPFKAVHFIWTIFYIIALDYSRPEPVTEPSPAAMQHAH